MCRLQDLHRDAAAANMIRHEGERDSGTIHDPRTGRVDLPGRHAVQQRDLVKPQTGAHRASITCCLVLVFRVSEASATAGIIVASIVVPLVILGVVGWFFWRASHRDRKRNG